MQQRWYCCSSWISTGRRFFFAEIYRGNFQLSPFVPNATVPGKTCASQVDSYAIFAQNVKPRIRYYYAKPLVPSVSAVADSKILETK
jgi:hypothetical protein